MDAVLDVVGEALWVLVGIAALVLIGVGAIFYKARFKVPAADQALVVTGGKAGLEVLPGRGKYVSPLKRYSFFGLGVMTVSSSEQETQTSSLVPIVVQWTAQLRPDLDTEGALVKAVQGFSGYTSTEISASLQRTLDGEVRAVVATMTPKEVVQDKVGFSEKVAGGVEQRMTDLGFTLVSLNIAEVSDKNDYYKNLAAQDRESQRQTAETLTAQADREVAVVRAEAQEVATGAELDRDLKIAEKNRGVTIRTAAIKEEMATAEGRVAVVEQQQLEAAAEARRAVTLAEAETEGQRAAIAAKAQAERDGISAQAEATIAQRQAEGEAAAEFARAEGKARALARTTEAETEQIRRTGLAQAEVDRAQGEAAAAATLAKGQADAEVQRLMAEALAANDGANLRVKLAEIQGRTSVEVAEAIGRALAGIGENATFIDMGGSSNGGGDLLTNVLGNLPELMKKLNIKSEALNGAPFGEALGSLVASVTGSNAGSDAPASPVDEVVVSPSGTTATPTTDVKVDTTDTEGDK